MAIITQLSKCPICGKCFGDEYQSDEIFGLSASSVDPFGEFSKFNDVGVHQDCFKKWDRANIFIEYWNTHMKGCENYKYLRLCIMPDGRLEYEYRSKYKKIT
jgi:hypothetical protein